MTLIKKYTEGLSVIEIYDDYKLNETEKEKILIEIYDLCNDVAKKMNFTEEQIKNHFYLEEELENMNYKS